MKCENCQNRARFMAGEKRAGFCGRHIRGQRNIIEIKTGLCIDDYLLYSTGKIDYHPIEKRTSYYEMMKKLIKRQ